jgi:hypothetical protein
VAKTSTARKPKPQLLTDNEIRAIAEQLAMGVSHRTEDIALLTLLFDHIQALVSQGEDISSTIYEIKTVLFVDTDEAIAAQKRFQSDAYANRGKLLLWPNERRDS